MKKMKKNNKGFTLIELLAVIVILAILMTLAVTSMSGYIRDSRKNTYISTANQYLNSIRYSMLNGNYTAPATNSCTIVSMGLVPVDAGSTKSTYGKDYDNNASYVLIYNNAGTYEYYVQMIDAGGNGFRLAEEQTLAKDLVQEGSLSATSEPGVSDFSVPSTAPSGITPTCSSVTAVYPAS